VDVRKTVGFVLQGKNLCLLLETHEYTVQEKCRFSQFSVRWHK